MLVDVKQFVGVLFVSLHIHAAQSLKEKRMVIRSFKDRIKAKFNVSVSELDGHDKWQRATIGFSVIGNEIKYVEKCLQEVLDFTQNCHGFYLCDHYIEIN